MEYKFDHELLINNYHLFKSRPSTTYEILVLLQFIKYVKPKLVSLYDDNMVSIIYNAQYEYLKQNDIFFEVFGYIDSPIGKAPYNVKIECKDRIIIYLEDKTITLLANQKLHHPISVGLKKIINKLI